MEDPESPGWFLCSNGEDVGINHPCEVRGEDDFMWDYVWHPEKDDTVYCGSCRGQMSKTMMGFYSLCAWDR